MEDVEQETPQTQPYDRITGEKILWYSRFLLYRDMGPRRNVLKTYQHVLGQQGHIAPKSVTSIPRAWFDASHAWQWQERAEAWDAQQQQEKDARSKALQELEAQEIERIMTSGYALVHERIKTLDQMARSIEHSFLDPKTDKMVYQWLNPDLLREWRGMLDDIAKELGQRIKKIPVEHSGMIDIQGARDSLLAKLGGLPMEVPSLSDDASA